MRGPIVYSIEVATISCAGLLAFLLRFDFRLPSLYAGVLLYALAVWIPVKLLSFKIMGIDRRSMRHVSLPDLMHLAVSNLAATVVSLILLLLLQRGVPRSVYALDFLLCVILSGGIRAGIRMAYHAVRARPEADRKRTIVYGAGNAGAALVRDLRQNALARYDVCGFVDDSPHKRGLVLHGVKVLGTGDDLGALVERHGVDLVLIAAPSASGMQMTRILERCTAAGIPYKTIPGVAEIIEESGLARQIRDVAVEDLLGRHPVVLDQARISGKLQGKVILVTGAAGSIGSEICRQIARFRPAAIIGFDIAESPVFHLEREILGRFPEIVFHAEIGSVQNTTRLNELMEQYRPTAVFHAAAYKHVPLMERHLFEAIENNVFGTLNVLEAARGHGVTDFVLISSDKAVRPANVMGATKRVAELLVRAMRPANGNYVSVRFGNVLGSNGSVVPIFKEQIARGGPVMVTHPEMRRFFMTIPEACQLVLQASTMGKGDEVFVLDMGEPVKIVDLAQNLILLSGFRPGVDIRIEFSGVRPGEKLYEELNGAEEDLLRTAHEKISVFAGETRPRSEVEEYLRGFRRCCGTRDAEGLMEGLKGLVREYAAGAQNDAAKILS